MNNITECNQGVCLPLFIGVDIAGGENTWLACISEDGQRICLERPPCRASLKEIVQLTEQRDVVAVAMDAQLSMAISDENGFRSSDKELRSLLPERFRCWVASINSLMAVPIRARILAEAISPSVATILETHPRASLYFASVPGMDESLCNYKHGPGADGHVERLWQAWCSRFGIQGALGCPSDGALDAAVCATVAYLSYHRRGSLLRLRHSANEKTGRGPFFVVTPDLRQSSGGA
jgi:predicted nuclease with RNAse H fold